MGQDVCMEGMEKWLPLVGCRTWRYTSHSSIHKPVWCIKTKVFWVVTPFSLILAYWHFEGTYCLHFRTELLPWESREGDRGTKGINRTQKGGEMWHEINYFPPNIILNLCKPENAISWDSKQDSIVFVSSLCWRLNFWIYIYIYASMHK
jgi:hypothetical protein